MYRAGCPAPGGRLLAAAALLEGGAVVADIGCDHGKLAVYLVMKGLAPRVVAVDKRPLPLARARALARQCGLEGRVDCRLGDGLAALDEGEAGEIVVAGLSGETLIEILEKAPWLNGPGGPRLILQPTTRAGLLRRWLCERGFRLLAEAPVLERGRAYTNILAAPGGLPHSPSALFCEVGLLPEAKNRQAAARLLQGRLTDLKNQRLAPLSPGEDAALQALIHEVEECQNCMR